MTIIGVPAWTGARTLKTNFGDINGPSSRRVARQYNIAFAILPGLLTRRHADRDRTKQVLMAQAHRGRESRPHSDHEPLGPCPQNIHTHSSSPPFHAQTLAVIYGRPPEDLYKTLRTLDAYKLGHDHSVGATPEGAVNSPALP